MAGWINGQIVATFRHGPCVFEAASGGWVGVGPRRAAPFVTDGFTLAGSLDPGLLTILALGQEPREITLPSWANDWAAWGSRLSPMPAGGYVFDLVPELAVVSKDGTLSTSALPAGYIVVGATSDPKQFVLRHDDRESAPEKMSGPYPVVLWRTGDQEPTAMPLLADALAATDPPNLVWLKDDSSRWWLIDGAGHAAVVPLAAPPWTGEPDPSGRYALEQSDRSQGCEHATPPTCTSRLVERASGAVLAQVDAASNSELFWNGGAVAFTPTTDDPAATPAAPYIVILTPDGISRVGLPPIR